MEAKRGGVSWLENWRDPLPIELVVSPFMQVMEEKCVLV